jgi:hypothetical protein
MEHSLCGARRRRSGWRRSCWQSRQNWSGVAHEPTFILDIPAETEPEQVEMKYAAMLIHAGKLLDPATDQTGFEEEWPPEVRTHFQSGGGSRASWSSLA